MQRKTREKQILASILAAVLLFTGIPIPVAAAVEGGANQRYSATPNNAASEDDDEWEEDWDEIPILDEDEISVLPATTSDAAIEPGNSVQPLILDWERPVINKARLLTTEVSFPGHIELELDVTEEEGGINYIYALELGSGEILAMGGFEQPLFTGTHTVELELDPWVSEEGAYEIGGIVVFDGMFSRYYAYGYDWDGPWPFEDKAVFNVVSFTPAAYDLNRITLQNSELFSSEYLKADMFIDYAGSGINAVDLTLKGNVDGSVIRKKLQYQGTAGNLKMGSNTIAFAITYLPPGFYDIVEIKLFGAEGMVYYNRDAMPETWIFGDVSFRVKAPVDPNPVINSITVKNACIQLPGTLDLEMNITAGNGGVKDVSVYLIYNTHGDGMGTKLTLPYMPGKHGEVLNPDQPAIQSGTYTFRFPVSLDWFSGGEYTIGRIDISDSNGGYTHYYEVGSDSDWPFDLPPIQIMRTDYAFEVSLEHPNLPTMLSALPDGSEVLLEGADSDFIPKAVFAALAGRDITVSIQKYGIPSSGMESLFTFNGKDINSAAIKDVPITYSFGFTAGSDYGIADKTVYYLRFDGSGSLPCPISFKMPMSSLLLTEDSYSRSAMYLSRMSGSSLIHEAMVSDGEDGYTEITLTSFSNFVLSLSQPSYRRSGGGSGGSSSGSAADAGTWIKNDTGWWYQYKNGTYPAATWKLLGGSWYYFEDTGYMATGWKILNGRWYWLDPGTGKMVADNWVSDRGNWYYLGADGAMVTGWLNYKDAYYYLSEVNDGTYGRMLKSEKTPDGYDVNQDGIWVP